MTLSPQKIIENITCHYFRERLKSQFKGNLEDQPCFFQT